MLNFDKNIVNSIEANKISANKPLEIILNVNLLYYLCDSCRP